MNALNNFVDFETKESLPENMKKLHVNYSLLAQPRFLLSQENIKNSIFYLNFEKVLKKKKYQIERLKNSNE